jgi:hypothetical protein
MVSKQSKDPCPNGGWCRKSIEPRIQIEWIRTGNSQIPAFTPVVYGYVVHTGGRGFESWKEHKLPFLQVMGPRILVWLRSLDQQTCWLFTLSFFRRILPRSKGKYPECKCTILLLSVQLHQISSICVNTCYSCISLLPPVQHVPKLMTSCLLLKPLLKSWITIPSEIPYGKAYRKSVILSTPRLLLVRSNHYCLRHSKLIWSRQHCCMFLNLV